MHAWLTAPLGASSYRLPGLSIPLVIIIFTVLPSVVGLKIPRAKQLDNTYIKSLEVPGSIVIIIIIGGSELLVCMKRWCYCKSVSTTHDESALCLP